MRTAVLETKRTKKNLKSTNKILKNNSFFSKKIVDYFWKNRLKENFNRIILRIMILEHFYSENRDK